MASRHFSFKTGKAGAGGKHAAYLAGEGKYAERDDVRHLSDHNMPGWAVDGRDFFAAADALERANGRSYSEVEFAIPRGVADPVGYARQYAEQLLGDRHPYRLAVHDKLAGDGGRNIHGHLMFTERQLDGIERGRDQFFKRANTKNPEKGGCAKNRGWNDRQTIQALRRDYEKHAKAHGIALDLRSNLAQGLTRPEPKIGPDKKRRDPDLYREARKAEVDHIRSNRKAVAQAKAELSTTEKELRNERIKQRRQHHRERNRAAGRTTLQDVRRIDALPESRDQARLLQRDERHHLEQRGLAEQEAARRVQQLAAERQRQQWRGRLTERREAWKACAVRPRDQQATPGKPRVFAWGSGKAEGRPAFVDYGDRLKPAGNPDKVSDAKIRAMLGRAQEKGWKEVAFTGPQEFRERCAALAVERGFKLADADLTRKFAPKPEPVKEPPKPERQRYTEPPRSAEYQRSVNASSVENQRPITPSNTPAPKAQAPAKPQQSPQSALAQARAARAQLDAIREQQRAKLAARTAPINPTPQAEPEPPQPSLAERIAASFAAMVEWVKQIGGELREVKPGGQYVGPVQQADEHHAVQSQGRGFYAIHRQDALDKPLAVGPASHDVKYTHEGRALVKTDLSQSRGMGR